MLIYAEQADSTAQLLRIHVKINYLFDMNLFSAKALFTTRS